MGDNKLWNPWTPSLGRGACWTRSSGPLLHVPKVSSFPSTGKTSIDHKPHSIVITVIHHEANGIPPERRPNPIPTHIYKITNLFQIHPYIHLAPPSSFIIPMPPTYTFRTSSKYSSSAITSSPPMPLSPSKLLRSQTNAACINRSSSRISLTHTPFANSLT